MRQVILRPLGGVDNSRKGIGTQQGFKELLNLKHSRGALVQTPLLGYAWEYFVDLDELPWVIFELYTKSPDVVVQSGDWETFTSPSRTAQALASFASTFWAPTYGATTNITFSDYFDKPDYEATDSPETGDWETFFDDTP